MNDTEQLIKEALGQLAERTPHPGPTLNALRRKRKRQRNNIFLIATAGMAAVVVLIFAGVVASDRYTPPNPNDAAAALVPGNATGALKYQPHWLPEGYVETFRSVHDGKALRAWVPVSAPADAYGGGPSIALSSGEAHPGISAKWRDVTVRGLKARMQVSGERAVVEWKAQDTLSVLVDRVTDPETTARRVADSVRADSNAIFEAPFKVRGNQPTVFSGTSPVAWSATFSPGRGPFEVTVSKRKPEFGSAPTTPVTVRGKQGVVVGGATVAVQEGDLWITATSHPADKPDDEIVAVVNDVELASNVDTGWIRTK
ncbi:hypothetical protein [Lentzea flaviverrucosa]|uniref:Uncharacterized protein n=1 Tax=Lentzea flaviverrucosa TaxID=200379 RepID=A0A1H9U694_9PSEU|nr:hypothetical protein [Lentzea flaviverrucosa]RDI33284.1 hypothetical protein DFR72_102533 [Lentzea flaviverrucosa]SES04842.1 hypothetical protein SAMN05216195_108324 [Lentzea flaviverrucosa]